MGTNVLIQGAGGGGVKLAPLNNPASASEVLNGKELYDDTGTKIIGAYSATLPTLNPPTISVSGDQITITNPASNGNFVLQYYIFLNGLPHSIIMADHNTYTFTGLADGTYYVKVRCRGTNFNDSADSNIETMTISTSSPIYGVSGLYDSATTLTRTDDAVGKSWTMSNNEISSDFDSLFPWNQMTRETINGNVFVKVPAIYWRIGYDSNNYITDIAVSEQPITAGTNQIAYKSEAFYYGAYKGYTDNAKLSSKIGRTPTNTYTRAQFRTWATANGTGYTLTDLVHVRILQFLWLIEFADKKSSNIMAGLGNYQQTTGATDTLTAPSGQLAAQGRMRYRYIEDFIGNGRELIDGIANGYVSADATNYSDDLSNIGTAFSISGSGANLAAIGIVDMNNPLLAPPLIKVEDNYHVSYFCGYLGGSNVVANIGRSANIASNSLFLMSFSTLSSSANSAYHSRLMIQPSA